MNARAQFRKAYSMRRTASRAFHMHGKDSPQYRAAWDAWNALPMPLWRASLAAWGMHIDPLSFLVTTRLAKRKGRLA